MGKSELKSIYRDFIIETGAITERFKAPLPVGTKSFGFCSLIHPYSKEMCVIRLHDAWARFCRELVFISAYGRPLSITGNRVDRAADIHQRSDVMIVLRSNYKKKYGKDLYFEPKWGDPTDCIRAADLLKLRNFANISASLGATPSPTDNLRQVRNFFAHRNKETAEKVRGVAVALGFPRDYSALQIVSSLIPPGVSILEDWMGSLRNMAAAAVVFP